MDYTQGEAADVIIATSESALDCIHSIIKTTNKRFLVRYRYYLGYDARLFKGLGWLNSSMTPCCSVSEYLACPDRGPYPYQDHHLYALKLARCLRW